jgi:hypothetical protein
MTVFGVQTHLGPDPADIWPPLISSIGCRETRVDFHWSWIEQGHVPYPTSGQYNWDTPNAGNGGEPPDLIVSRCAQAGLYPLPVLGDPPDWAKNSNGVITDLLAWGRFCYQCVERYRPGGTFWQAHPELQPQHPITTWEIMNEPNQMSSVWSGSPQDYVNIYNTARSWIKARAGETGTSADVILGGLAWFDGNQQNPDGSWSYGTIWYLTTLSQDGLVTPEAIGFHPYGYNEPGVVSADGWGSGTAAYVNTIDRIKQLQNYLGSTWSSAIDITEDGIPLYDFRPSPPGSSNPPAHFSDPAYPGYNHNGRYDRYDYFWYTLTAIQQSYPRVRRYSAYTWISTKGAPEYYPYYNFDIVADDGAHLLTAGEGYEDGIRQIHR